MTSTTLQGTHAQRIRALHLGDEVRAYRATIKHDLKTGVLDACAFFDGPVYSDRQLTTMRVRPLLLSVPRLGPIKTDRMLRTCGASLYIRVGQLTARQRGLLSRQLDGHRARWDVLDRRVTA